MKTLINWFKKRKDDRRPSNALKKKSMLCSTEAAAISIGIHVLLILFAGSIVAIRYVQKQEAAFSGDNVSRPRLERRQLQMPVKVRKLQQKSSRPKVTTRMAGVSPGSFSLPDMSGLGGDGPMGFDRVGSGGDRDLSSLGAAGSLGFGVSGINFFGVRSKGEKPIFIVEADERILEDDKGGFFTYRFVKDRIYRMIDGMQSATLFNVLIYRHRTVRMFRSEPVPATPENKQAIKDWLAKVNDTPADAGKIDNLGIGYSPSIDYKDSMIKDEAANWLKSIQAAMEQRADTIFVLTSGWGHHLMSEERRAEIFEYDPDQEEEWLRKQGWPPSRIRERQEKIAELDAKAREILEEENEAREKKGLPPKIIAPGGFWNYRVNELGLEDPPGPPDMMEAVGASYEYTLDQIIKHLEIVAEYNYRPHKLPDPELHIVNLIAADANPSDQGDDITSMRETAQAFGGDLEFLRGAESMENLIDLNRGLQDDE